MIPIFVRKALAGEPLTLAGGGLQTRRFVYVEDIAEGVVAGLAPQAADRTYNLVGDEEVTIREIAERVRDEVGDVEMVLTEGRAGDFRGAEISGARAAAELGWSAQTPFAEGLRRYVAWHRRARRTWRRLLRLAALRPSSPSPRRRRSPFGPLVAVCPSRASRATSGSCSSGVVAALFAALAGSALLDGTGDVSHYAREHAVLDARGARRRRRDVGCGRSAPGAARRRNAPDAQSAVVASPRRSISASTAGSAATVRCHDPGWL